MKRFRVHLHNYYVASYHSNRSNYEFTEVSILEDREERMDSITYSWPSMIVHLKP